MEISNVILPGADQNTSRAYLNSNGKVQERAVKLCILPLDYNSILNGNS